MRRAPGEGLAQRRARRSNLRMSLKRPVTLLLLLVYGWGFSIQWTAWIAHAAYHRLAERPAHPYAGHFDHVYAAMGRAPVRVQLARHAPTHTHSHLPSGHEHAHNGFIDFLLDASDADAAPRDGRESVPVPLVKVSQHVRPTLDLELAGPGPGGVPMPSPGDGAPMAGCDSLFRPPRSARTA